MNSPLASGMRLLAAAALLIGCLSSCTSGRFNRDWEAAKKNRMPGPAGEISGAWEGRWKSATNSHEGTLRCIVSPDATGAMAHLRFQAVWAEVLSGRFNVLCDLSVERQGVWKITGKKDLGKFLGGEFRHSGTLTAQKFAADYDSQMDRGTMTLHRPQP